MKVKIRGVIMKKMIRKLLLLLVCFGIFGAIALFGINAIVKASVKDLILTSEEAAELDGVDCILILGAGVWEGGRPSPMLEDRLLQGIELYQAGVSDRLLMSGDHGRKDYDEVNVMKQYAIDAGIPSENIFMDHAGFSTYESLYRARDIFEADKILLITQEYHLYRSLYVGNELGLEVYGVASDPRIYAGQSYREAREVLARVKDFFYALIKPEPTYLGDSIPVSGNGNLTND
jgi:vancomycin permeability regulator SanA